MSEFERDDLVGAVLTDVSREVAGHIRPMGAAAAVRTVRRRRKQRVVAGGILAAALIVAPLTGLALAQGKPDPTPTVGTEVSASAGAVDASPQGVPTVSAPKASDAPAIPASELRNATLPIAPWPSDKAQPQCQSGQVKFTDGKASGDYLWTVGQPLQVDIDGDGGKESVVQLYCRMAQSGYARVVVFDRAADGGYRNVGTVLTTLWGDSVDGKGVAHIWEVQVTDEGRVRLDVGDFELCCDTPADLPQHQWRTYGWNGTTFVQTDGPSTFPPNKNLVDLSPSAGEVSMVRQPNGEWKGLVRVTVRNAGAARAADPVVFVKLPADTVSVQPGSGVQCSAEKSFQCKLPALAPGASTTLDLVVFTAADPAGKADVRVYDEARRDGNYGNNEIKVTVRAS